MKKNRSFFLIVFLTILSVSSAIADKSAQSITDIISIDEVYINSYTDKTILKKTAAHLPKKEKRTKGLYIGLGQHTQIIECNDRAIQLSRYYGNYTTNGGRMCVQGEYGCILNMSFLPQYNASSLRYNASGSGIIETNFLLMEQEKLERRSLYSFNAYNKYVFDIMACIYANGPLFSSNINDYTYRLKKEDGSLYTYSFESSDRYPKKNGLYAKGKIVIDTESFMLKSIYVENMGLHNVYRSNQSKNCSENEKRDCVECSFSIDKYGEICYALVHIQWGSDIDQCFSGTNQPRMKPSDSNCRVTECWKTETCAYMTKAEMVKFYYSLLSALSTDSIPNIDSRPLVIVSTDDSLGNQMNKVDANLCKYNEKSIDNIKWAIDVSGAEKQLSRNKPIKEQYIAQSGDSFNTPRDLIPDKYLAKKASNNSDSKRSKPDTVKISIQIPDKEKTGILRDQYNRLYKK